DPGVAVNRAARERSEETRCDRAPAHRRAERRFPGVRTLVAPGRARPGRRGRIGIRLATVQHGMSPLRRGIIVLSLVLLLWIAYRVFAVYTVRSGECKPKPVDPN